MILKYGGVFGVALYDEFLTRNFKDNGNVKGLIFGIQIRVASVVAFNHNPTACNSVEKLFELCHLLANAVFNRIRFIDSMKGNFAYKAPLGFTGARQGNGDTGPHIHLTVGNQ